MVDSAISESPWIWRLLSFVDVENNTTERTAHFKVQTNELKSVSQTNSSLFFLSTCNKNWEMAAIPIAANDPFGQISMREGALQQNQFSEVKTFKAILYYCVLILGTYIFLIWEVVSKTEVSGKGSGTQNLGWIKIWLNITASRKVNFSFPIFSTILIPQMWEF